VVACGDAEPGVAVDDPRGPTHDRDVREERGDQARADRGPWIADTIGFEQWMTL
jgi:hypothetical protein